MGRKKKILTEGELEIMKVVWELGDATVRQVYEVLRERQQIAYTTVLTMMNILENKGHLLKETQGRAYRYRPVQPKQQVIGGLVDDFLERVFNGAAPSLVASLIQRQKLSDDQWQEIQQMVDGDAADGDVADEGLQDEEKTP